MKTSFSEHMAQGKDLAQERRNAGEATTVHKSWSYKRYLTGLDAIEQYLNQWRKDVHYHAYAAVEYELFHNQWEGL